MGKKKPTLVKPTLRMTKKERSHREKERRIQNTFIIVLVAIGVVAVILLAFGLLYDLVWYPSQVVAEVNGQPLHRSDYWAARRMTLVTQWQQTYQNLQLYQSMGITLTKEQTDQIQANLRQILSQLGQVEKESFTDDTTMQTLIEETVVFQGATELGITVSDEEADAFLLPGPQPVSPTSPFGSEPLTATVSPTQTQPVPTPVSTLTPQQRVVSLTAALGNSYDGLRQSMRSSGAGSVGFSVGDYLAMVRRSARLSLMQQRVQDRLAEGLPKEEEQVQASYILIKDRLSRAQQAYQQALQAVSQGQSLARTVVQYSDDAASRDRVGLVEIKRGEVSPALEAAALALTATEPHSAVIADTAGVHLLKFVRRNDAAGSVAVQHILIPADRKAVADQVWNVVLGKPDTFASVATSVSEDKKTAGSGGDLGWIVKGDGQLSALVEASAFALTQTNMISAPILDEQGYHILQMVGRDDAGNRVNVRQILILNGAALAQQLLEEVQDGTRDFSQAVVDYSEDKVSLDQAGDIGWVSRNDKVLSAEVISAALALSPTGSLTSVIEDDKAYTIVQMVERDDAGDRRHLRIIQIKRAEVLLQEVRDYIVGGDTETRVSRFIEMAARYSDDTGSKNNGGELGWFGRGKNATTTEIEDLAFALPVDQISEVMQSTSGWGLIWVRGHEMNHPIDQATLDQRAQEAFDTWKNDLVQKATIVRYPPPTATPTPTPPPFVPTLAPVVEPTRPVTGTVVP